MSSAEVEAYLSRLPPAQRATLEMVRAAIRAAAPSAVEGMSYGMPAFIQDKPIAGYAASAAHCSFHPMSGTIIGAHQAALADYATSKGTVKFNIGQPLPAELIAKLVHARLEEIA